MESKHFSQDHYFTLLASRLLWWFQPLLRGSPGAVIVGPVWAFDPCKDLSWVMQRFGWQANHMWHNCITSYVPVLEVKSHNITLTVISSTVTQSWPASLELSSCVFICVLFFPCFLQGNITEIHVLKSLNFLCECPGPLFAGSAEFVCTHIPTTDIFLEWTFFVLYTSYRLCTHTCAT